MSGLAGRAPRGHYGGMAKKPRKPKAPDPAEFGFGVLQHVVGATGDTPPETPAQPEDAGKDPGAVELGRKGGLTGGPARAASMTKAQRVASAKKAAAARWAKRKGQRPR